MLSLTARRAAALVAATGALAQTGCQTPLPAPTPLPMEQLEGLVAECGGAVPALRDTFYEVAASGADTSDVRVTVEVSVAADDGSADPHGEHELGWVDVRVVDAAGRVVGIAMANGWRELSGLTGMREAELGACPSEAGMVGETLSDGDYQLIVTGSLQPLDHAHAQQEVWHPDPIAITVASGVISVG